MKSGLGVALLFTLASSALRAAQPFSVVLPDEFAGPEVASRGLVQSYVYTRASTEPSVKTLFQVTVIPLPPEAKGDRLEKLLAGMLGGVERRRSDFKKSAYAKGSLGSAESLSVDWTGIGEGHSLKGRMICAVSEARLFCVHFQDLAKTWEKSLPTFEQALHSFKFSK